jgi:hypothetical protein
LRSGNQFEQFMRIVQQIGELVMIFAQRSRCDLRRHARILQPRVRGYEAEFIDADSLRPGERRLQLQC